MPSVYYTDNVNVLNADMTLGSTESGAVSENILVDCTAGIVNITLPDARMYPGRVIKVKKIDATANAALVSAPSGQKIDGVQTQAILPQWALASFLSAEKDGAWNWYSLSGSFDQVRKLNSVVIPLTTATTGELFTVPSQLANGLLINRLELEGVTDMTGVLKVATLKMGTAPNYSEILGTVGQVFTVALGTSLLPINGVIDPFDIILSTVSQAPKLRFAPGTALRWSVSGASLLSTGSVRANLYGTLN